MSDNKELITNKDAEEIKQLPEKFLNNFNMDKLLVNAGNVELTDEQNKILFAPIDETQISIKPTGIVYLSWSFYATRLRLAFGMQWALIPNGMPLINEENLMTWGFYLYIKGSLMGFAIGEQNYIPKNKEMSYTDACEGAKSNALMRLCKGIGIGLELWQQEFVNAWKKKYAESYQEYDEYKKKNVIRWKKRGINKKDNNQAEIKKPDKTDAEKINQQAKVELLNKAFENFKQAYDKIKEVVSDEGKKSYADTITLFEKKLINAESLDIRTAKIKTNYKSYFEPQPPTELKLIDDDDTICPELNADFLNDKKDVLLNGVL
jgi:phage pi2 protein 07